MKSTMLSMSVCHTLIVCLTAGGCGRTDLVNASGNVRIDGQPATSGRIAWLPLSGGERADSLVAEDGAFLLRTKGIVGAKPGSYRVIFSRPMSEEKNAKEQIGDLPPAEITAMYHSPVDQPVTIPETDVNDLEINIDVKRGWTRTAAD